MISCAHSHIDGDCCSHLVSRLIPYGSNAVRLSGRGWGIAAVVVVALFLLIPWAWERIEPFEPGPTYRVPYALSDDYWHYARYCRYVAKGDKALVVGDSVIWGEYVPPEATLVHHLNERAGADRFVNLGVNGIHPAALAGLLAYYGRAIRGKDVLLHYNPLWMSSKRHDLQTQKEFRFNHPKLVPQFSVEVPCYKAPYADRLGIVAERYLPLRQWTNHLAIAYFDQAPVPAWALEHPYESPARAISLELPQPNAARRHDPAPWTDRGIAPVKFEWVSADTSLQWRLFQRTVKLLQGRNNRVFVLVGPFNEHMIAPESRETYQGVKTAIAGWLEQQGVPHLIAPLLPSDLYADASHPLSEGYAMLAGQLLACEDFRTSRTSLPGKVRTHAKIAASGGRLRPSGGTRRAASGK